MDVRKRFVVFGQSRLASWVTNDLVAAGHHVLVVYAVSEPVWPDLEALGSLIEMRGVTGSVPIAFEQLDLEDVRCILAVSTNDEDNLHVALTANKVAPNVPVVLRTFDEALAQALDQGTNIRAAFSVSALAAPSFVGAALSEEVLATLILGEARVLVCRIVVDPRGRLVGRSLSHIESTSRCRVLWASHDVGSAAPAGTILVLGGLLDDILVLARDNEPPAAHTAPQQARNVRRRQVAHAPRRRIAQYSALILTAMLLIGSVVFHYALDLGPVDTLYFVITTLTTTGYGDITLQNTSPAVKIFGSGLMLADTILVGVLFSYLAAWMTTDWMDVRMGRRAARSNDHAIIAGLGNVGYRVQRIFHRLGIPTVVMERSNQGRFVEAVRESSAVLVGDAALPESLEAAGIARARYFIAVTDDDMTNIQGALQARRLNPDIHTVTRVVNPHLAELLPTGFTIDAVLNPTVVASDAFVGAATDQRIPRTFEVAGQPWTALRWTCDHAFELEERLAWGRAGIHIIATENDDDELVPAPRGVGLPTGTTMVLAGPSAAVQEHLGRRSPATTDEFGDLT